MNWPNARSAGARYDRKTSPGALKAAEANQPETASFLDTGSRSYAQGVGGSEDPPRSRCISKPSGNMTW